MIEHVTEFDLSRKVWIRNEQHSRLVRKRDGKMCCLGVYLKACGFEEDDMEEVCTPKGMAPHLLDKLPPWLAKNHDAAGVATVKIPPLDITIMNVNDESILDASSYGRFKAKGWLLYYHHADENEREEKIINLFKKNGVTVNIVD